MATLSPPPSFVEQRRGKTSWWMKAGWEAILPDLVSRDLTEHSPILDSQSPILNSRSLIRLPPPSGGNPPAPSVGGQSPILITGGRGTIQRIEIDQQEAIIVRLYRRGGFVRYLTRDLYWDCPPRPFVELNCAEEVRRRGVPTVEVLGARVEWTTSVLYRGLLITRQAVGFHNLWDWLHTQSAVDLRRSILGIVAQVIATMHRAGIAHADLNPTNILVCSDYDPPQALLIDFDRARRFPGPVPAYLRESNLRRFRRFFNKNDILEEWITPTEFEYFRQVYEVALPLKR